jgi:DNA-binding MarR family transcriptional regulator
MQFGVLVQLSLRPGLSSGQLARLVLVTPQSMGELIHSIEQAGWVTREQGIGRGRPVRIRVTAAGQDLLRRATPIAGALNVAEVLSLTVAERWLLNSLLHKVRDAMTAPEFRDNVLARIVADDWG